MEWVLPRKVQPVSLEVSLLISLLFWLPMEPTYLGRGYNYLVGLNESNINPIISAAKISTVGIGILWGECLLMATIFIPLAIVLFSSSVPVKFLSSWFVCYGFGLWVIGGTISTIAHFSEPATALNFIAGAVSGAVVYFASRRVRMTSIRHYELAFRAIAFGFLLPMSYDLFRYFRNWGVPSLSRMILEKYNVEYWSSNSTFGNPDNTGCVYYLLFALSCAFCMQRDVAKLTRVFAWCVLSMSASMIFITMARQFIILAVATVVATLIFERRKSLLAAGIVCLLVMIQLAGTDAFTAAKTYFEPAISYNQQNDAASSRVNSMRQGWQALHENPISGVGSGQSFEDVDVGVAHQLAISQGSEDGVLGLAGILLATIGCVWRFIGLLREGPSTLALRFEYAFLLGPALYFASGLISEVGTHASVVNTWICLVCASIGIAENSRNSGFMPSHMLAWPSVCSQPGARA
jgi:hypothetical protein